MNMHHPQKSDDNIAEIETHTASEARFEVTRGLSSKLLLMTVAFVMIAEILIFVPSVANFRNVWLKSRLDTAEAASIVFLDSETEILSQSAGDDLLKSTMAVNLAIRQPAGASLLMASKGNPGELMEHINLSTISPVNSIISSLDMLFQKPDARYRVFATMRSRDATIEIVQEVRYIQDALWTYSRNVLILSLLISVFTAALVYFALYRLIVLPIIRISRNMDSFSKELDNPDKILKPSGRTDEIGIAENRISIFQTALQKTLRQKQHMADLGMAVSKINHDMRNILASAQLFSDRLMVLPDPTVQRFTPKLIRSIDRAVDYTKSVLDYGKAVEAPPKRRQLLVRNLVHEISETLGLGADGASSIKLANTVADDLTAFADPEQLFRVLMNLCRNGVQALNDMGGEIRQPQLTVSARRDGNATIISVADNGPGIPEHVRSKIFTPFEGSTRAGGTGLGLTIAMELIRSHNGTITISETSENGTVFEVKIPDEHALPDALNSL